MTTEINQKYSILMFSDHVSLEGSDLPTRKEQNDLWNGEKRQKQKLEELVDFFQIPRSKNSNKIIYTQERLYKSFQILDSFLRGWKLEQPAYLDASILHNKNLFSCFLVLGPRSSLKLTDASNMTFPDHQLQSFCPPGEFQLVLDGLMWSFSDVYWQQLWIQRWGRWSEVCSGGLNGTVYG